MGKELQRKGKRLNIKTKQGEAESRRDERIKKKVIERQIFVDMCPSPGVILANLL